MRLKFIWISLLILLFSVGSASATTVIRVRGAWFKGNLFKGDLSGQYYDGLRYNEDTDAYARIGPNLSTIPVGQSAGDALLPIQAQMRRCIVNDAGEVVYYLCSTDSTKKADCSTAANLDGTDGQVVVKIPKFYYRYTYIPPHHEVEISLKPALGFTVHPAFVKNGAEVDHRYIGAYEAYNDSGKLSSISGVLPTVSQTRATFRTQAEARGTGWHQLDFYLASAIQLLYLIEYGDFDSQAMIGAGLTGYAAWPGGPQALTGNSNSIGNATGDSSWAVTTWAATTAYSEGDEVIPTTSNGYTYRCTVAGMSDSGEPAWPTVIGNTVVDGTATWECVRSQQYMSYRGIENWFGHIWKFVDGFNVHNSTANGSRAYICGDYTAFADDTDTDYTLITSDLAQTDGYTRTIVPVSAGFLPLSVSGGSSSTGLADYYYTYYDDDPDSGWRVCLLGGPANYGAATGAFCWYSARASSSPSSNIGGRLAY